MVPPRARRWQSKADIAGLEGLRAKWSPFLSSFFSPPLVPLNTGNVMYYTIRFKTFKQMAYAFSLSDSSEGSRFYYCKAIAFPANKRHYAASLWSFLQQMSDDPTEDFTLTGCNFGESEFAL